MNDVTSGPTIFCDMDGVLVDFIGGAGTFFGTPWHDCKTQEEKHARNTYVFETPGFWETLPPMPGMLMLWNYIAPFKPNILTALPKGPGDEGPTENSTRLAKMGKPIWCRTYLQPAPTQIYMVPKRDKQLFATKVQNGQIVSNILIDDNESNIIEWKRNRGVGILHTSVPDTLNQLSQLNIRP
jgi:hypothetical protein